MNRTDKISVPVELIQAGKHTGTYSVCTWRVLHVQAKGMVTRGYVKAAWEDFVKKGEGTSPSQVLKKQVQNVKMEI